MRIALASRQTFGETRTASDGSTRHGYLGWDLPRHLPRVVVEMNALYWDWVESESALIKTDGCSKVSGAYRKCCWQHDLSYYYAADPVSAYLHWRRNTPDYWRVATPLTKGAADASLRRCIQSESALGFFSPVALWRWLGVRVGASTAWASHRAREQASAGPATALPRST